MGRGSDVTAYNKKTPEKTRSLNQFSAGNDDHSDGYDDEGEGIVIDIGKTQYPDE